MIEPVYDVEVVSGDVEDVRRRRYATMKKLKAAKERALLEDIKKYPALHWARTKHVNTRNQKMSFVDLPYLLELYKIIGKTPKMVVEKSVQCGLSELFIIQSHYEAGELGLTVMYVLPKYELRNRFVNNRIYKLHKKSASYWAYVVESETKVHRTSLMHFGKGTLAYVGSNVADEFIEIPVDSAYVDEKDRCNLQNLLYIPDRLTASPNRFHREISNPTVEGFGIDERYSESTKGVWMLKCPGCGEHFTPNFFQHVVNETSPNVFVPRDENADADPNSKQKIRLIHDCGSAVDRLSYGEWVHEFPSREWVGFRVSKIFTKFTPLRELYKKWIDSVGNDLKTQIFYNSDLGLPYSSEGSKITRAVLNDCRENYEWPVRRVSGANARFMGVDVGADLHVVLRERVRDGKTLRSRLIGVWVVPGFSQLEQIIREWSPKCVVIDSLPEIHKVMELKEKFDFVLSSRFQEGAIAMAKNDTKRELAMDRTALLDYVKQGFDNKLLLLPMQAEFLEGGAYYSHLQASTRILEVNEDRPEKSRFVWREGSRPDHFLLAEAYCLQAGMVMPDRGIFEFFGEEADALSGFFGRRESSHGGISDEERIKISEMQHVTPDMALLKIRQDHAKQREYTPPVDDEKIRDAIWYNAKISGYVDMELVAESIQESPEDVKRVLLMLGFVESRIHGRYVK